MIMETFTAIPDSTLLVKVHTDTAKKVSTRIYDTINGSRIKPHLLMSEELENGSIDLIGDTLIWKSLGCTNQFKGHVLEIYTIVHYLPAHVISEEEVKKYLLENVSITYALRDDAQEVSYAFDENDKIGLLVERTGIIFKYIAIG